MENEDINKQPVKGIIDHYDHFLALVEENPYALKYVDKDWISNNSDKYKEVVQVAVNKNKNGCTLSYVNKDWAVDNFNHYYQIVLGAVKKYGLLLCYANENEDWLKKNPEQYYDIVIAAVTKDAKALKYVDKEWANNNSQRYYEIALGAVKQNGGVLERLNHIVLSSTDYYKIALAAVNQDGWALEYVNEEWVKNNPTQYYDIVIAAVNEAGTSLKYVDKEWAKNNPTQYYEIVKASVNENGYALVYVFEDFRNYIHIVISSLMDLDAKLFSTNNYSEMLVERMFDMLYRTSIKDNILLYLYIFSNKNVSNNLKYELFEIFIKKFDQSSLSLDKFKLYKNILECYLVLSNGYQEKFLEHQLLKNLSDHDSKELHMFLSVADPSALKNDQFAKLLKNHDNHIIKNYLTKDTYNLKSIKNFNIYASLFPKNLFVVHYDKIIDMMKNNTLMNNTLMNKMRNDLIKLILCYFRIEDLLALSEGLDLEDKLQVKYLDIDPKFERKDGHITIGIEAWVDAIKNDGSLSNRGKYLYDSYSTIYNSLDIELSQQSKLIEYNL